MTNEQTRWHLHDEAERVRQGLNVDVEHGGQVLVHRTLLVATSCCTARLLVVHLHRVLLRGRHHLLRVLLLRGDHGVGRAISGLQLLHATWICADDLGLVVLSHI